MGNYQAEKRRKMKETQNLNSLFRFKIEERKATFPRVQLHLGCIYLPTCPIKTLWDFILRWNSLISIVTMWCLHEHTMRASRSGSVEWNSCCWRTWHPYWIYFTDLFFFKLFNLWFPELRFGIVMNHIF